MARAGGPELWVIVVWQMTRRRPVGRLGARGWALNPPPLNPKTGNRSSLTRSPFQTGQTGFITCLALDLVTGLCRITIALAGLTQFGIAPVGLGAESEPAQGPQPKHNKLGKTRQRAP